MLAVSAFTAASIASAASRDRQTDSTYIVITGDYLSKIAVKVHMPMTQLLALNPQITNPNIIYPNQILKLSAVTAPAVQTTQVQTLTPSPTISKAAIIPHSISKSATISPTISPTAPSIPSSNEQRFVAYTTGYGWPDNTPPGGDISSGILHFSAGGSGTYQDPITLAVGHSISGGKDTLDYQAGTRFYIPAFKKYFIAEDTCGDGSEPQNGPCHTGYQGHPWLDLWVGGEGYASSPVISCAGTVTDTHLVIQNPASNYAVVPGPLYSGSCTSLFGDTVSTL